MSDTQQPKYPIDNVIRIENGEEADQRFFCISVPCPQTPTDSEPATPADQPPVTQVVQKSLEFTGEATLKLVADKLQEEFHHLETIEFFHGTHHVPLSKSLQMFAQPPAQGKGEDAKMPHAFVRLNGIKYKVDYNQEKHKKGVRLFKSHQFAKALLALNTHVRRYPDHFRGVANRALCNIRISTTQSCIDSLKDYDLYWEILRKTNATDPMAEGKMHVRRAHALKTIAQNLFFDQIEPSLTIDDVLQQLKTVRFDVGELETQLHAVEQSAGTLEKQRAVARLVAQEGLSELIYIWKNKEDADPKSVSDEQKALDSDALVFCTIFLQSDIAPPVCPLCHKDVQQDVSISKRTILSQQIADDLVADAKEQNVQLDDDALLLVTPKYFMCNECNSRVSTAEKQFVDTVWSVIRAQPASEFSVRGSAKFLPLVAAQISYHYLLTASSSRFSSLDTNAQLTKLRKFIAGIDTNAATIKHYMMPHYANFSAMPNGKSLIKDYCESSPISVDLCNSPSFVHVMLGKLHLITVLSSDKGILWPSEFDVNRQIDIKIPGDKKREFPKQLITHLEKQQRLRESAAVAAAAQKQEQPADMKEQIATQDVFLQPTLTLLSGPRDTAAAA